MTATRSLWLIRHGEAAGFSHSGRDEDRALHPAASSEADSMLPWLLNSGQPGLLLHSTARRTAETAALLADAWGLSADCVLPQRALYLATADTLLDTIQSLPTDLRSAAIVGHNPGISLLASDLASQRVSLATFGCALLSGPEDWLDWRAERVSLKALRQPDHPSG